MLSMSFMVPKPAWDAPATAFVGIKLDGAKGEFDNAGLVVNDDHSAGAEHGAGFAYLVEVHAQCFDLFGQQDWRRRATRNYSLELAAAADAAAYFVDHFL